MKINWRTPTSLIISNIALSSNDTKMTSYFSIKNLAILKAFNIKVHPRKSPIIMEVVWQLSMSS